MIVVGMSDGCETRKRRRGPSAVPTLCMEASPMLASWLGEGTRRKEALLVAMRIWSSTSRSFTYQAIDRAVGNDNALDAGWAADSGRTPHRGAT